MSQHVITFDEAGGFGVIYSDDLLSVIRDLGHAATLRASDVEPCSDGWTAYIRPWVPGGDVILGPFSRRSEALAAEVAFLKEAL